MHAVEPTPVLEEQHAEPEAIIERPVETEEAVEHPQDESISAEPVIAEAIPEHHPAEPTHHEVVAGSTPAIEEHVHEGTAFEPEHASASYRVDPVAPSEYRLSAVAEE